MMLKTVIQIDGFSSREEVDNFLTKSPGEELHNLKIGFNPDKSYFIEYEDFIDYDGEENGKN